MEIKLFFLCNLYHHAIKSVIFRIKIFSVSFNFLVFTLSFMERLSDILCRTDQLTYFRATEHYLKCYGQLNWLHPKTLTRDARYKSSKIRETLEILRSKCDTSKLNINRNDDNSSIVIRGTSTFFFFKKHTKYTSESK